VGLGYTRTSRLRGRLQAKPDTGLRTYDAHQHDSTFGAKRSQVTQMENKTPVLQIEQATVRVRDGRARRVLLSSLSLTVGVGEVALIQGPSGAGKTTLLALAGLLISPTEGEVRIQGEPTSRFRDAARARARRATIGMVFQDYELLPERTALENVLLPAVPLGPQTSHRARAEKLLAEVGLSELAHTDAVSLSGGERQRVALARALLFEPKLLLLDEPTAHLDEARSIQLCERLQGLASAGCAIVLSTHDARLRDAFAKHAQYTLNAGVLS
jgi:putative ABC transport system ATP-binding protein